MRSQASRVLATQDVKAPKALLNNLRVEISVLTQSGCGNCADVCPGKKGEKALIMVPFNVDAEDMVKGSS